MNAAAYYLSLFTFLSALGVALPARAEAEVAPPEIRFVPEMEPVPELDKWTRADGDAHKEAAQQVKVAWKSVSDRVKKKLAAAEVIKLSKWAKPQMQTYQELPSLDNPDFKLQTALAGEKKLLFEATLQVLPSHSPIVTRWLKLFVVYDQTKRTISQVIITIRGQVLE